MPIVNAILGAVVLLFGLGIFVQSRSMEPGERRPRRSGTGTVTARR